MVSSEIKNFPSTRASVGDEIVINDVTDNSDKKITVGSILDVISGDITVDERGISILDQKFRLQALIISASDEITDLETGTAKTKFRMPYGFKLKEVRGSLSTIATGSTLLQIDVNSNGTTIFSTKLTFNAGALTTTSANIPAVINVPDIDDDSEITIDIIAVGNTTAGRGLKITFIGNPQ